MLIWGFILYKWDIYYVAENYYFIELNFSNMILTGPLGTTTLNLRRHM